MTDQTDPIGRLSDRLLLEMAADVAAQLQPKAGMRPVLWLISQQRDKASSAISMLMNVDPTEAEKIRTLQNEMKLYVDLLDSCARLMMLGNDAYHALSEEARSDVVDIAMSDDERQLFGIEPERIDS